MTFKVSVPRHSTTTLRYFLLLLTPVGNWARSLRLFSGIRIAVLPRPCLLLWFAPREVFLLRLLFKPLRSLPRFPVQASCVGLIKDGAKNMEMMSLPEAKLLVYPANGLHRLSAITSWWHCLATCSRVSRRLTHLNLLPVQLWQLQLLVLGCLDHCYLCRAPISYVAL
jgi:hypothetical protein